MIGGIADAALGAFPSPPSNGIEIGPLNLRAYGLLIALGVIAAVWLCGRMLERKGISNIDDASSAAVWGVGAGIVGARLYHVVTDWDRFSDDLGSIVKVWEGGLGIPGGLLAGVVAGAWQARRRGIPPAMMITCAAPAIPLAQAIGRFGNWFNQELYGRPTDLPWALEIDDEHLVEGYASGTTFHPTFLYESLWNIVLVVVLLRIDVKYRLGPGRLMGVYAIGYGLGRLWVEGLRIDPSSELGGLRWNQWVAMALIVGGAAYLWATRGQRWPADAAERVGALRAAAGLPPVVEAEGGGVLDDVIDAAAGVENEDDGVEDDNADERDDVDAGEGADVDADDGVAREPSGD